MLRGSNKSDVGVRYAASGMYHKAMNNSNRKMESFLD
jgi:hypothetical protein